MRMFTAKCNSLADLRDAAVKFPSFKSTTLDSLAHVKSLLVKLLERLELKGKKFTPFFPASDSDIDSMWEQLLAIDSSIEKGESLTAKNISSKENLVAFMEHCCTVRHYSFQIKKCVSESCTICKPI